MIDIIGAIVAISIGVCAFAIIAMVISFVKDVNKNLEAFEKALRLFISSFAITVFAFMIFEALSA